ncbi:MAG: hypothetical protein ACREOO_04960 [bacterium]
MRRIVEACRQGGGSLHLVDNGKYNDFELRRYGEAGVFIYGTDLLPRSDFDWRNIAEACRQGGARLIFTDNGKCSEYELRRLAEIGAYIHLSSVRTESEIRSIGEKMK